jgi:hypothetical protein
MIQLIEKDFKLDLIFMNFGVKKFATKKDPKTNNLDV